jgi:hypothetical protein
MTPAIHFLNNFTKADEPSFYDVFYAQGNKPVLEKLPKALAYQLSQQMGKGYEARPSKD